MLVVTNYPQVPIATSNVATDAARVENQQRPPIIPPKEATKGHEDRSFNAQNERLTEQTVSKNLEQVNQKQQQQSSDKHQQQEQKSQTQADKMLAQLRKRLPSKPALQRSDIRVMANMPQATQQTQAAQSQQSAAITQEMAQAFGQHIGEFYQQQTHVDDEPMMSSWI